MSSSKENSHRGVEDLDGFDGTVKEDVEPAGTFAQPVSPFGNSAELSRGSQALVHDGQVGGLYLVNADGGEEIVEGEVETNFDHRMRQSSTMPTKGSENDTKYLIFLFEIGAPCAWRHGEQQPFISPDITWVIGPCP